MLREQSIRTSRWLVVVAVACWVAACATPLSPTNDASGADSNSADTTGGDSATSDTSACTPKRAQCVGPNLEVCADDGSGSVTVTCQNGCQNGECKPAGVCTPNTRECQPNKLRVCNADGQWVETTCELGCDNGACVTAQCSYGQKKCESAQLYVCKEDRSWQITDCPYGCANNACLDPVCAVDEKRCSPTDDKQPQICNSTRTAFVDNGAPCAQFCNSGACQQAACQPGETRCSLDKSTLQICNANQTGWEISKSCGDGCVVGSDSKASCALCSKGQRRCTSGVPELCDATKGWIAQSACDPDSVCRAGQCLYAVLLDFLDMNENYNELAYYMAYCWQDYGSGNSDVMCFAINSAPLPQTITYDALRGWFCDGVSAGTVTKANFASVNGDDGSALFSSAEDMFGCVGLTNAINFSIETQSGDLPAAPVGTYCLYLDATLINEVFIDECSDFSGN